MGRRETEGWGRALQAAVAKYVKRRLLVSGVVSRTFQGSIIETSRKKGLTLPLTRHGTGTYI